MMLNKESKKNKFKSEMGSIWFLNDSVNVLSSILNVDTIPHIPDESECRLALISLRIHISTKLSISNFRNYKVQIDIGPTVYAHSSIVNMYIQMFFLLSANLWKMENNEPEVAEPLDTVSLL